MINRNRRALGAVLAVCIAVMTAGCAVLADKRSPDSSFGYEDVREQETEQTEQSLSALPEVGEKDASCQIWNRGLPEDTILPRSYDYREEGRAPQIGNQALLEPAGLLVLAANHGDFASGTEQRNLRSVRRTIYHIFSPTDRMILLEIPLMIRIMYWEIIT
mgnify:CR=1 FL=1